jgi:hypothetical protein
LRGISALPPESYTSRELTGERTGKESFLLFGSRFTFMHIAPLKFDSCPA